MTDSRPKMLVIEAQRDALAGYHRAFSDAGFRVFGAASLDQGARLLEGQRIDVCVLDCAESGAHAWLSKHAVPHGGHSAPRVFAIGRLPYDEETRRVARLPAVKLLTMPLPVRDLVNAVRIDLAAKEPSLDYGAGLFQLVRDSVEAVVGHYLRGVVVESPAFRSGERQTSGMLAIVPLSGPSFLGTLALYFDRDFAIGIARGMLGDAEGTMELSDHDVLEAVSETSNQISGALQERLIERGHRINIGLPRALTGDNLRFIHPGRNKVGEVKLSIKGTGFLRRFQAILGSGTAVEFCFDQVG